MSRLQALKAFVARNRVPLGVAGAAAVVGVAVLRSRGGGGETAGTKGTVMPTSASSPQSQLANASGAYSSTDSDLYNAFQPQVEELRDLMKQLQGTGSATSPTPTPAAPPAATPATALSVGDAIRRDDGVYMIQGAPTSSGIKSYEYVLTSDGGSGLVVSNGSALDSPSRPTGNVLKRDPNNLRR